MKLVRSRTSLVSALQQVDASPAGHLREGVILSIWGKEP